MKTFLIIFLIIILIIISFINNYKLFINLNNEHLILLNDIKYFNKFSKINNSLSKLVNNNKLNIPNQTKNKILFISYDNRYNENYIMIHNDNILKYTQKYNYEYKYYEKCDKNTYWCKIYLLLKNLNNNLYDYIVWLDSDTIIKNFDIDLGNILNMYSSDIFIGSDNNNTFNLINSGVFIIKNSKIGINFLKDCIHNFNTICIDNNGKLKGIWAGTCYEQGVMNILIADKYSSFTTILTNDIIFNYNVCSDNVFIMHLYRSSSKNREKCFNSKNYELSNQ